MESAASVLASVEEDVKLFQERLGLAFATSEGEIKLLASCQGLSTFEQAAKRAWIEKAAAVVIKNCVM